MSTKRICMVAYTHYAADARIRIQAEALVQMGHEVIMFVPRESAKAQTQTICGVQVHELHAVKYQGKNASRYILSYFVFLAYAFLGVSSLFLRRGVDIVHVHNIPDFLVFAGILPRMCGRKLILDIHDTVPETFMSKFHSQRSLIRFPLYLEERISCWLAHRIVLVNHVQRQAVLDRGIPAQKTVTFMSVPDIQSVPRGDADNRGRTQRFRLVNHGTIAKRLGNDLIVEAAAALAKRIPGFELHIVGAGDDLNSVVALSKALGLDGRVHFHPLVPCEVLYTKLRTMDAGIVGNRRDIATELMLPVKLMDYVALGIPAVVPRLRGIEYYFTDDMVSYFEPENVESMVAAVLRVYDDRRRYEQPVHARTFLSEYGWETNQAVFRSLYQDFLEPKRTLVGTGVKAIK